MMTATSPTSSPTAAGTTTTATTASTTAPTVLILEHPAGAASGGVWYLQCCEDVEHRSGSIYSYYYEDSPGKTVELWHAETGEITPLKPHQRVFYCLLGSFGAASECYDVHGTRIENVLEQQEQQEHSTIQPLAKEYRVVRPAARHRPPGTLKGGTWYQQTLHEETSFGRSKKRLLYREEDRYYTETGLQVHPPAASLIRLGKDEEDDDIHDDNDKPSSLKRTTKTDYAGTSATSISSMSNLTKGPIGSPPGGKWFKQTLTSNTGSLDLGSRLLGCCVGFVSLGPPEFHEPERYVYEEPPLPMGKKQPRYVDVNGRFADPRRGPLSPLPEGFDPMS